MLRRALLAVLATFLLAGCGGAPGIPHAVSRTPDSWCLTCHLEGLNEAAVTPHPDSVGCVSCHTVEGTADVGALGGAWPGPAVLFAAP